MTWPDGLEAGATRYRRLWVAALTSAAGYLPMDPAQARRVLGDLSVRLCRAVLVPRFDAADGQAIGAALVAAHLTDPGQLGCTVRLIGTHLAACAGLTAETATGRMAADPVDGRPTEESAEDRVAAVQGAVAAGYSRALRKVTLAEQERLSMAVLQASARAESQLRDSEARFRAVFAGAATGIGIATIDGRIVDMNAAFCEMLGYTPQEMREINVTQLVHPDDAPGMWEFYGDLIQGKYDQARLEKRYFRKDGSVIWTDLAVSLIRDNQGGPQFTVAMIHDITERYELQERLRFQALHDPLTGLPNRTLFFDCLGEIFGAAGPQSRVGVCYLDLDGFKTINDSLGHDIGDQLLVQVAGRLLERVSRQGYLVARMGGDEFVILVIDPPDQEAVVAVAEQVLETLAIPCNVAGHRLSLSASIGVVEYATSSTNPAELMKAADVTLYWAKSDGRKRWAIFDSDRHQRDTARYALAAAMPRALERGEFIVEYQPIVRLTDGSLLGVEALVRWEHPELGLLMPDAFIGLAEETGLIVPLGRWVLEETCRQASRWNRDFPAAQLVVSVNLAAQQAQQDTIAEDVARTLQMTGLPAALLQLELTESAAMDTAGKALPSLNRLGEIGVQIAIDDFGTGYSNLAYLRTLPIQNLKLAGPFVAGLRATEADPVDERIVDALVRLAHALALTVTAEAVETQSQADALLRLGCDTGQGYLYARPRPPVEITALLAAAASARSG